MYYDGIHTLPSIDDDELKAYFKENLDVSDDNRTGYYSYCYVYLSLPYPLIEEFECHEGVHFYIESALMELYRYAMLCCPIW